MGGYCKKLLQRAIDDFNKNLGVIVADNSERVYKNYFCVGAKAALVGFGFQAFKCVDLSGNVVFIGMGDNNRRIEPSAFTGFVADNYVGINAGASVIIASAVYSCEPNDCKIGKNSYYRSDAVEGKGGTINGAYGFLGAYIGAYSSGSKNFLIQGWQGGIALEASFSSIIVSEVN